MKLRVSIVIGLAAALAAHAAPKRPPVGRNVRVLTHLTSEELYGSMLFVSAALGVRCDHCHARSGFDRDEKPTKETARKMMKMVAELRRWAPAGAEITCYTCHRGQPKPQAIPPLTSDADEKREGTGGALPSLDEVVLRHRRATGDEARLARLSTMVVRGRATFERLGAPPSAPSPIELVKKAPDKLLRLQGSGDDAMTIGANGAVGWRDVGGKVFPLGAIDLAQARREAMFAAAVDVRAPYERMTVVAAATFGGAAAVIVDAVPRERSVGPLGIDREELTFDARSGLLLRRRLVARSALGAVPSSVEYGDFRAVDGVTLPFRVRRVFPGFAETLTVDDVKLDVPVPDARFEAPAK